jgi:MORN repeat
MYSSLVSHLCDCPVSFGSSFVFFAHLDIETMHAYPHTCMHHFAAHHTRICLAFRFINEPVYRYDHVYPNRDQGRRHGRGHEIYGRNGKGHGIYGSGDSYCDSYDGEYEFDQRHGQGVYKWRLGTRVYNGMFSKDMIHGMVRS